jgi:hypothetical protein
VATLSDLVSKVRMELNDQPKQFNKTLAGDGSTKDFPLGVKPVDVTTLEVRVNGVIVGQPSTFTIEAIHGVIHFNSPPANNAVITVTGSVFRYFSDSELEYFVNTALTQHTFNKSDNFGRATTVRSIPAVEEYPIVILSTVEALYALATDSAFDINIFAPDGVSIPRSERYHQLMALIGQRMEQYRNLCAALNIGLWRIEVGTLRRVSRTTNKLVPVFMPQEIDDSRRPERVYLPIDMTGRTPVPSTVGIYDIILQQGDSWTAVFDFPNDLDFDDLNFKAEIRTYPNSPSRWAVFNIAVEDAVEKKLRLSLTKDQTEYLPVRSFWDIQATSDSDPDFEQTYLRGQVFCERQITLD